MSILCVHSFRGGTGKSLLASTLAYKYSKEHSKKVLLIDGDYGAPCLDSYFPVIDKKIPFTDYLQKDIELTEVISETSYDNLFVSYAPKPSFGVEILKADSKTHGKYLKKMIKAFKEAQGELGFDEIIIDASSGMTLTAINQFASSDCSISVIGPAKYGINISYELLKIIFNKLGNFSSVSGSKRKDILVWNLVPLDSEKQDTKIINYLDGWNNKFNEVNLKHVSTIPYMRKIMIEMIIEDSINVKEVSSLINPYLNEIIESLS